MVVTLLVLIVAILLFGAAAIRGAIAKVLIFLAVSIALASMVAWAGDGVWLILSLALFFLWVASKAFEWDKHLK